MKINVVGAGALGTILGAHLAADGHSVTMLARGARAAQLRDSGLRVEGLASVDKMVAVVETPDELERCDLLIVTVKTYDNATAIAAIDPNIADHVFSVANGVLKNDELVARFGADKVFGCMADTSGELNESGVAMFTRNVCLHLGALEHSSQAAAEQLAALFRHAGIESAAAADIRQVEWSKFVGWTSLLVLSVTTRVRTAQFLADSDCAYLAATLIREMRALASAKGIAIIDQSPVPVDSISKGSIEDSQAVIMAMGREWQTKAPDHRMSCLQDLVRGKRLEVEETIGYAVRESRTLGIAVPALETCYAVAAAINATAGS